MNPVEDSHVGRQGWGSSINAHGTPATATTGGDGTDAADGCGTGAGSSGNNKDVAVGAAAVAGSVDG